VVTTGNTVEFGCVPRPIARAQGADGGPLAYRVTHDVRLWATGQAPSVTRVSPTDRSHSFHDTLVEAATTRLDQPLSRGRPMIAHGCRIAAMLFVSVTVTAQQPVSRPDPGALVPSLTPLVARTESELANVVERFSSDQSSMNRRYDATQSPDQRRRMREFYTAWRARLGEIDFDKLEQEGRVDYVLLDSELRHDLALLDREDRMREEAKPLLPFADQLLTLHDQRRNLLPVDPKAASHLLTIVSKQIDSLRAKPPAVPKTVANRAADNLDQMRGVLTTWYRFYDGYDPVFSWWMKDPYTRVNEALTAYAKTLRERVVGFRPTQVASGNRSAASENEPIVGDPIGESGLEADLVNEMIPYTPEELIAIAQREYSFSLSEAKKAARQMGFGDDWRAAMEKVKNTYVEPGKQPELIRDLARQAEAFFDKHDWVTIPPLAREDWRMEMLSPERQRVSPFFLGGDLILVSYPTDDMSDEDKLMSLRGNNPHFSHATVFHELNPGHHLQGFMSARYNSHRRLFSTPFWNEGQSLYWEMFLWDHGFQVSPEDRLGALFWRMHRSARIIFSLSFHLGKMSPEQAIQFLVDSVDFERANAEAEVRRSFNGSYSPLYQIAYMIGGLQLRALHHEIVDTKKMSEREFHDAVLQGGPMPITMVRARLTSVPLSRRGAPPWKWASSLPAAVPAPSQ
jgi:uncharacterized protein (DUF885 family)